VYRYDRHGDLIVVADLSSSSIYGCSTAAGMFFSTMVEPSEVNFSREICVYGSADGFTWNKALSWQKDAWPMALFQYGNAFLPDGQNGTDVLAVTTAAVKNGDGETTLWRVLR
jgi:hypothetical protein